MSDTLAVVTADEARQFLGLKDAGSNPLLDAWIVAVSRRLDEICGPIVKRAVTDEAHDGGETVIRLAFWPLASVTSVTEYDVGGTATTLDAETFSTKPAAGYAVRLSSGLLYRRASGRLHRFAAEGTIVVSYVAGRYDSTATVDERVKRPALTILAHNWRVEHGTGNQSYGGVDELLPPTGFAIPARALEMLGDLVQWPANVG